MARHSLNLSRAEVKALGTRMEQPKREEGEILHVFVSGRLKNPLNDSTLKWHGLARASYMRGWKDAVANVLLGSRQWRASRLHGNGEITGGQCAGWIMLRSNDPKVVIFKARTHGRYDSDGLEASLKACRDALTEAGVISGDGPNDGHTFVYEQQIDRARRGVEIIVRRAAP